MNQKHLKKIRVIISLVFLSGITFLFLDFRKLLPDLFYDTFHYLQFIPSLLKFLTVVSLSALGFIIIVLLTAFFGRVYCSTICPLGIFQDVITWFKKKIKRKVRFKYSRPLDYLRYPLLAMPALGLALGSVFLAGLLDPFSNYGRFVSDFLQPAYIWLNNAGARLLGKLDIYFLYPQDISHAEWVTYLFPLFLLALIVWLSLAKGRLYCNTICPVGTLLGLLSRISVFRIRMIESQCTKCGKCSFACKAYCINVKNLMVDFSRCVGCFNCISVCPEDAIKYLFSGKTNKINEEADRERRKFLSVIGMMAVGLFGLRRIGAAQDVPGDAIPTEIRPEKNHPVTPPGSLGIEHFTGTCTACHLCVSACPTQVLQPSVMEYGFTGLMQPHMDYSTDYCNFECTICSEICPTGAILSLSPEAKKTTQIGQVHFIMENCIVYTDNTSCGSCSEHCPTQAVKMVPYTGELTIPEINPLICVGCGACEYACPTKPFKAIFVDGNPEHMIAQKLVSEELEEPDLQEEFPF